MLGFGYELSNNTFGNVFHVAADNAKSNVLRDLCPANGLVDSL